MAHNEKVIRKRISVFIFPRRFCRFLYQPKMRSSKTFPNIADFVPHKKLFTMGLAKFDLDKSLAFVDSMVYCMGGTTLNQYGVREPTNEVAKFNACQPTLNPVYRLSEPVVSIQYEALTILIGTNQDAIIYNVADESSLNYNFDPETMSYTFVTAPVTVFSTKTMYWIDDVLLRALDTHIHYQASMREAFPDFDIRFINSLQWPVLVHLKDDMFNMFTMFGNTVSDSRRIGLAECTNLRVTKCKLKSGKTILQVDLAFIPN